MMPLGSGHQDRRESQEWLAPRTQPPQLAPGLQLAEAVLEALLRLAAGMLVGTLMACIFVAIGVLRVVAALIMGARVRFEDLHLLLYYVGGFVAAGAVIGLASPLGRHPIGRYSLGVLAAAIVFGVFAFGESGSPRNWDDATWFASILCSLIFGIAGAYALRNE